MDLHGDVVKMEDSPEPSALLYDNHREQTRDFESMKTLPMPMELLVIATRYVNAAHKMTPVIAAGYSCGTGENLHDLRTAGQAMEEDATDTSHASACTYADFISTYRRYMLGAIACCGHAVRLGTQDIRLNLRAHLMLAELLARETHNTERTEKLIGKGLALASTHESLAEYRFHFICLQIELSLAIGNVKFAKTLTKKTAIEIHRDHPSKAAWLYRFQLLFIRICQSYERDYPSAMAALGDMVQQARTRQHLQLEWTLLTMRARLAMLKGDLDVASSIITELARDLGLPVTNVDISDVDVKLKEYDIRHQIPELAALPLPLLLQFLVLLCIYQTHVGQTTAARQNIRRAQFLLDQKGTDDGLDDRSVTLVLPHTDAMNGEAQSITVSTLPRSVFYAYTFLISTIVQLDPVGRHPKCLHFAAAGLERLTEMLDFGRDMASPEAYEDSRYAEGPIENIEDNVKRLAAIKLDLMLTQGDLLLMRSSLPEVHAIIVDLVDASRSFELWDLYKPRIVMLQAMFSAFIGDLETAFDYYAKVLEWVDASSHLGTIARASLLFIRLAQGYRVRLTGSDGHTSSPTPKKRVLNDPIEDDMAGSAPPSGLRNNEDLEGFAKDILRDCRDQQSPSLKLLSLLVEALVNGEISRAKRNLSLALQLSSDVSNQHVKPVILALLACQFTNTRNDQAFRMLHSAHTVCGSMGGADKNKDGPKVKSEKGAGEVVVEIAGLAKLGLWIGEHLLDTYETENLASKVARQREHNARYQRALSAQKDLLQRAL